MKYPSFFLLLISFTGFSQPALKTRQDTINVLCSDWKLLLTESNGEKIPVDKGDEKLFLIKKDGKYQMKAFDFTIKGAWTLDKGSKIFTTNDEEGIMKWTLIKVSAPELILEATTSEGTIKMFLKRKE